MSISVCVCLSACIFQRPHGQTSQNVLYVLSRDVVQSSDDHEIHYVLPVLWMTSCLPIVVYMHDVGNIDCSKYSKFPVYSPRRPCCFLTDVFNGRK